MTKGDVARVARATFGVLVPVTLRLWVRSVPHRNPHTMPISMTLPHLASRLNVAIKIK